MKPYNKSNIPLAKRFRKEMTPWERKLWYDFLRYYPVRFQRQKALGDHIADFYCAKARLVIELDGSGHYTTTQIHADECRTAALESLGLQVVRICNLDIDRNFAGVCEYIDTAVQKSLPLTREVARRAGGREKIDLVETVSLPQSAALTAPSSEGALSGGNPDRIVFALGFFDGVHLGHQALLKECCRMATEQGCETAAITFHRHPQSLFIHTPPALINSADDRMQLLRRYGIAQIYSFPVTQEVMQKHWVDFIGELLESGAAGFVCGDDFRFGHQGQGNAAILEAFCRERGLAFTVVPPQTIENTRISSTHIRGLIESGQMEEAVRFLGHPHILSGQVVSGRKLGRTIGIPTANLRIPEGVVCPAFGVYACKALVDGREYAAVTNVGTRPTVGGQHITVEPWLLDFEGDLYDKHLTLSFCKFLRPEKNFHSLEELREEILKNAEETRTFFENL